LAKIGAWLLQKGVSHVPGLKSGGVCIP